MKVQNVLSIFICFLCLNSVFYLTGCEKTKTVDKSQKEIPQVQQEEVPLIPLDDSEGVATLTRNFYFIFDGSGSMANKVSGGEQQFENKLVGAKWAVRQFMTKVPDDVNLGLYVFDGNGRREVVALGSGNRERFLSAVEQIRAGGGTPLFSAITFGADQLVNQYKQQLGYGEYRLIVVTDGIADNISSAARYTDRFGIPIYTIGLYIGEDHPLRQFSMSYRAADNFEDLARALEETVAELPSFDVTEFQALQ